MLRQATILFVFFAFTFSTIDELVKLCFDKIECIQEFTDSESGDLEKEVDLDKIFHSTTRLFFQATFVVSELSLVSNHSQNYCTQVIYTIVSPPPEV